MKVRILLLLLGAALLAGAGWFWASGRRPAAAPGGVRRIGEHHWTVPRSTRDAFLADPARLNTLFLLKPEPGNDPGSVKRLVVVRVDPAGPFHEAGFRVGDLILSVNGAPVATQERALNLLHEARTCASLRVDVGRGRAVVRCRVDFE